MDKHALDTLVNEVIDDKWGNGSGRKNRLEAAGYDYNQIQHAVNEQIINSILDMLSELEVSYSDNVFALVSSEIFKALDNVIMQLCEVA